MLIITSSTPSRYTLKEVVDFCWANKKRRCFKGYTFEEVCKIVIFSAQKDMLKLVQDEQGICGVAIIRVLPGIVHVDFLVTVRNGFKTFIAYHKENFPDKKVVGQRDGKTVTFNTRILWEQLQEN